MPTIKEFFKVSNIELNYVIELEVAVIDEGIVKNNPALLTHNNLIDEIITTSIIVYEGAVGYSLDNLVLSF